jgi:hypothetical protein
MITWRHATDRPPVHFRIYATQYPMKIGTSRPST